MIFHVICLLTDNSHEISYLIFVKNLERCRKICCLLRAWLALKGLTLNMLDNFHAFVVVCWLFSKRTFSKKNFRNAIRVSNGLDLNQDRHFVCPDSGPNCLQRLSNLDNKLQQARKELDIFFSCIYQLDTGENQIFKYLINLLIQSSLYFLVLGHS